MRRIEEHNDTPGVTTLVATFTHPLVATLEAVRRTILAADPAISEGVKWKSPSFYCQGWFVTISYRKSTQLDVVLHCGAKVQSHCTVGESVNDPDRLLSWPSKDRAVLAFKNANDFRKKKNSFQRIVRQWADYQKRSGKKA